MIRRVINSRCLGGESLEVLAFLVQFWWGRATDSRKPSVSFFSWTNSHSQLSLSKLDRFKKENTQFFLDFLSIFLKFWSSPCTFTIKTPFNHFHYFIFKSITSGQNHLSKLGTSFYAGIMKINYNFENWGSSLSHSAALPQHKHKRS